MHVKGQPPQPRFNHSCCMSRGRLQSLMLISGGITNTEGSQTPFREQKDEVLFDLWTLDLTTKSWSEVVLPRDLVPGGIEGHMSCCWDNRDKKVLIFGGSSSEKEEKDSDQNHHAFEVDLDPSWNVRFRKANKKLKLRD